MPTIAETVVHNLAANGIQRIWGVPGDSLNAVTEAIRREKGIEWMLARHEEEAAFAAAGEAALTGELAVCAGSCGPGNMHLINGLHDAHRSRVPVLAIASHIPSDEIGSQYFQETRPTELFRDCTVFCEMVLSPEQMPRLLEIAMRTAIEKRGVAVLVMAGDTALEDAVDERVFTVRRTDPVTVPSPAELQEAAATLNSCDKVTILAGAGVEGAREEVLALADALGAPIVHALRGKEFIESDNPFDVGMTGLLGFASGYRAMEGCEALLMLGTDFPADGGRADSWRVHPRVLCRVRVHRGTAVRDGVGQISEMPRFVAVHLAEPVPGAVRGQPLKGSVRPDVHGAPAHVGRRLRSGHPAGCLFLGAVPGDGVL
ncbi:thiamine pyrophosphate-dependent acetolactate synthase large subunit-like protein [Arthrobacter sp. UYP6]